MKDVAAHERAAALLARAAHTLVLTGAGISAESGIPTFRTAQTGLWARFAPEDLATGEAFAAHPERVWAWYRWRRTLIARGGINSGHEAIARLGRRQSVCVATQNVDGLHTVAGNEDVLELHGNLWRERCLVCGAEQTRPVIEETPDMPLPRCTECHGPTRPAMVWFGETLPANALAMAGEALERADCILVGHFKPRLPGSGAR